MEFIKKYYKYILCFILGFALCYYAFPHYITTEIQSDPIVLQAETKDVTNASLVKPEVSGEVVRFIDKGTEVSAVINGKEYAVPNTTSSKDVSLGENSTLKLETQSTGKVDITPLVNQMLAAEVEKERMKWEKEQKHFSAGVIVSNKGTAPKISYENSNYNVGAFYTPKFYGGELEFKF